MIPGNTTNNPSTSKKPDSNLRDKEDGFSIYLMGANEERIKNLRKKEQIEKIMKTRSNNNSKSLATRKRWDQVTQEKNEKQIQPKSPINTSDRSKSKEIKNITREDNLRSNNKETNNIFQNHNSNNNLEDILFNMNKNVNINLNKLDMESPGNVRNRKNWGEPKYNVIFPDSSETQHRRNLF